MSPQDLPTIVLVHGAWSRPEHFSKLVKSLQHAGFSVHTPPLPTCNGARPPDSSFDQDVAAVRSVLNTLIHDQGQDVMLMMHSYGGLVGSQAAEGLSHKQRAAESLSGGITAAIYICAYMCHGKSVRDMIKAAGVEHLLPDMIPHNDDETCTLGNNQELLYGDLTAEDQADAMKHTVLFNGQAFHARNSCVAWRDIYTVYVRTTKDSVVPEAFQDSFLEDADGQGLEIHVQVIESGHSPHIKDPERITEIAKSAAAASRS